MRRAAALVQPPSIPESRFSKKRRLTSSPRLLTPTFSKALWMCRWTVCSETKIPAEISQVVRTGDEPYHLLLASREPVGCHVEPDDVLGPRGLDDDDRLAGTSVRGLDAGG
jgi:hypothetical protein